MWCIDIFKTETEKKTNYKKRNHKKKQIDINGHFCYYMLTHMHILCMCREMV